MLKPIEDKLRALGWEETTRRFHRTVAQLVAEREINRQLRGQILAATKESPETDEMISAIVNL